MSPVREVTTFHLRPGLSVVSQANRDNHIRAIDILLAQPGCRICIWGVASDHPDILVWIVDWDDMPAHQSFIDNKDVYNEMISYLKPFCDESLEVPIVIQHIPVEKGPAFFEADVDASLYEVIWAGKGHAQASIKPLKERASSEEADNMGGETIEDAHQAIFILKSWELGAGFMNGVQDGLEHFKFQLCFERRP